MIIFSSRIRTQNESNFVEKLDHRSLKRGIPLNYGNPPKSTDEIEMVKRGFPPFGAYSEFVHESQLHFQNYKLSNMYICYQEKNLNGLNIWSKIYSNVQYLIFDI